MAAPLYLGLGAGPLANMLIPGQRSQGLILTCAAGVAGAVGGGWLCGNLFRFRTLHGFFHLSTGLTAIARAAVLLLIFNIFTMRGHAGSGRRTSWANRCPGCADGGNRPFGTARAPSNGRAADWLYRSRGASQLRLSPAGCAGQVP